MNRLKLTNFKIIEREGGNSQTFYIIFDNNNQNNNNAYFCFDNKVRTGWEDLNKNWQNIKELEIEWEENEKGKRVISIWSDTNLEEFLI